MTPDEPTWVASSRRESVTLTTRRAVPDPDYDYSEYDKREHKQESHQESRGTLPTVAFRETRWALSSDITPAAPDDPRTPHRRAEFAAGRRALRDAGRILRLDLSDLPVAPTGAPLVPRGVAASLTHTGDYVAAVASADARITMIGIDAEPWAQLDRQTVAYIATETEAAAVEAMTRQRPAVPWGRILFTAKEAVFKALSPMRVRFNEASIRMRGQALDVTCDTPDGVHRLHGCWSYRKAHGTVLTLVWGATVPADRLDIKAGTS